MACLKRTSPYEINLSKTLLMVPSTERLHLVFELSTLRAGLQRASKSSGAVEGRYGMLWFGFS